MKTLQKIPIYFNKLVYSANASIAGLLVLAKHKLQAIYPVLKAIYPVLKTIYPVRGISKQLFYGIYPVWRSKKQLFCRARHVLYCIYPGMYDFKDRINAILCEINPFQPGLHAFKLQENSFQLLNRLFLLQCFWYCNCTILYCLRKLFAKLFIKVLQQQLYRYKPGHPHLPALFAHCRPP